RENELRLSKPVWSAIIASELLVPAKALHAISVRTHCKMRENVTPSFDNRRFIVLRSTLKWAATDSASQQPSSSIFLIWRSTLFEKLAADRCMMGFNCCIANRLRNGVDVTGVRCRVASLMTTPDRTCLY